MTVTAPPLRPKSSDAKRRQLAQRDGTWLPFVPVADVQRHIAAVRGRTGMTLAQFAALADLHPVWLGAIARGRRPTVFGTTALKIFAVTGATPPPAAGVSDSTGTRRRLQAMAVAGWTAPQVAAAAGVSPATLLRIRRGDYLTVYTSTASKVTAAYDRLWLQRPPQRTGDERGNVARTRRHAVRQGWMPGAAWDDIDDPADQPRGVRHEMNAGAPPGPP